MERVTGSITLFEAVAAYVKTLNDTYRDTLQLIENTAKRSARAAPLLLAVSKTRTTSEIHALAALGQRDFGENYVQEALAKQPELSDLSLLWHCIGPLQSNKCKEVAEHFDWLQTLDRAKLIEPLNRYRPSNLPPLNVLIQVNIDDETSKSGCKLDDIDALAKLISQSPRLRLRGLMAIPAPKPDPAARRGSFAQMRRAFDALAKNYPDIDTLSMGMSDNFAEAIAEGTTMVRIGTALFGPRVN